MSITDENWDIIPILWIEILKKCSDLGIFFSDKFLFFVSFAGVKDLTNVMSVTISVLENEVCLVGDIADIVGDADVSEEEDSK